MKCENCKRETDIRTLGAHVGCPLCFTAAMQARTIAQVETPEGIVEMGTYIVGREWENLREYVLEANKVGTGTEATAKWWQIWRRL